MNTQTQPIIDRLEQAIAEECNAVDREEFFREMLDECFSFDSVGGPFQHMQPSRVLEQMDPVAFRCGVNDFADGEPWVEVDGETYQQGDAEKVKEGIVDELERELDELTNQLLEEQRDNPDVDVSDLEQDIARVKADLETLSKHSF